MLTDHHCHLHDPKFYPHLEKILSNAKAHDITRFLCCGTNENDWQRVLDLNSDKIIPAIGIHPWEVENLSDNWQKKMEEMLQQYPVCLVGEIGLDLHFCKDTIETQQEIFILQLEIAQKYKRPVCIHNLKTWHLMIPIIQEFPNLKIMLHSFWASPEIIEQLSTLNVYYSISGTILERSDKKVQNLLSHLPINRILLETDSPYLLPKYEKIMNREFNEPANLIFILERMAEIMKLDIDKLKKQIEQNSERFLAC